MLASCNNNTADQTASTGGATTSQQTPPLAELNDIERVCIPVDTANERIGRYHHYLDLKKNHDTHLSFMLDAAALRQYLDNYKDITKLDVYLAFTKDSQMTLVYVGAKDSLVLGPNKDTVSKYAEIPYYKPKDVKHKEPQAFDRTLPCPDCDRIRIYTNQ